MGELSPQEWSQLKDCWAHAEALPSAEREAWLMTQSISAGGREMLLSFIRAEDDSSWVDQPAHQLLGLEVEDSPVDSAPSMVGRRLGPFRVTRLVGRGGMGAVYEAERADDTFRQRVAIKTVWRGADSEVLLQRFRSERQILAALQHANIAQLLDGGATEEGTPWLAMEFIEGTPIDVWCDAHSLSINQRLDLFRQVCAGVSHAHQRLVVHRDLKPSNILVNSDGTVKLLDFGVAKLLSLSDADGTLTSAGLLPFTAAYAAPEQLDEHAVSTAIDVYALGGVLTLLLAGSPPRDVPGLSTADRLAAVRQGKHRAPSVIAGEQPLHVAGARAMASPARLAAVLRGELDSIADVALRYEPSHRYSSVEALSEDVLRYLRRMPVIARKAGRAYRVWSLIRRRQALTMALLSVFTVLVVSATVTWRQARAARSEALRAEKSTAFLSGLVTGYNATSYDPLVRVGPTGSVAQLLDSMLIRIPGEFSNDPRTRARLYTAIGSNLVTQGRMERALEVLDSAQMLAAAGYGRSSVEYARARLEQSSLGLGISGPPAAVETLNEVRSIVAQNPEDHELRSRFLLLQSAYAMQLGHVREADSLAKIVLHSSEGQPRNILTLRAEGMRLYTASWLTRDPREYLRRATAIDALTDSLGLTGIKEQINAVSGSFEALTVLGRSEHAGLMLERLQVLTAGAAAQTGVDTVTMANNQAALARLTGDTAAERAAVGEAMRKLDEGSVLEPEGWLKVLESYVNISLANGTAVEAVPVAQRYLKRLQTTESPLILGLTSWHVARIELAAGNPDAALEVVKSGEQWIAGAPDLVSVLPLLARVRIAALTQLGRIQEADSVRAAWRPAGSYPPCTPGGNWKGCPDLPQ